MSQVNVERIIGLLATDEGLRRRFSANPRAVVTEVMERGLELNECEQWSLAGLDPHELVRFAEALGPRLQRTEGGRR